MGPYMENIPNCCFKCIFEKGHNIAHAFSTRNLDGNLFSIIYAILYGMYGTLCNNNNSSMTYWGTAIDIIVMRAAAAVSSKSIV